MWSANLTASDLAAALCSKFPDAHVEADEYVKLTSSAVDLIVWVSASFETLRIRSVVFRHEELMLLTELQRDELTADLNGQFVFGRFNAKNLLGLLYEHELPYVESIALDLVTQSIEVVGRGAKAASELVERKLKRAARTKGQDVT